MHNVKVYSTSTCPYCVMVKEFLKKNNIQFENIDVGIDRQASQEIKALQQQLLRATVDQIDRDGQVSQLDYYDSRGALLPWCVGLGGEEFYSRLLASARIYEEPD